MTYDQVPIAHRSQQSTVKSTNGSRVRPYVSSWRIVYWCLECLLPIMDEATSTKPPPYSTVIKHDRRLRDYPMPGCPIPGVSVSLNKPFLTGG